VGSGEARRQGQVSSVRHDQDIYIYARLPGHEGESFPRGADARARGYKIVRQKGSHRILSAEGRPVLRFSYHDKATVPPGVIRKYLVDEVGLDANEAHKLLRG
jgi:predicted RNA binding protein YcfA (HicA-like mRNA interferase family)